MIEGNEETLSTRDLASPSGETRARQPAGETATQVDDTQEAPQVDRTDEPQVDRADESQVDRTDEPRVDRTGDAPASDGESTTDTPRADQVGSPASPAGTADRPASSSAPLLPADLTATFQDRWEEVQTRFVDEPRGAVEEADGLVANLMQQLAEGFAEERERLEAQWGRGEDISTEDLRVALQRYRSFFQRLLAT
jgi:hypothetical protein